MKIFGFEIGKNKEEKKEYSKYDVLRLMREVGVPRDAVIGDYKNEENPDDLDISTYIRMQQNDGTVQAIIRMLSLPIQSADSFIVEAENDNGEADFIRTILFGSEFEGGMSTPMALVISDMTRAIAEGFRAYNKKALTLLNPTDRGWGASTELLIEAKRHGFEIVEVPVIIKHDVNFDKRNLVLHGINIILNTIKHFIINRLMY